MESLAKRLGRVLRYQSEIRKAQTLFARGNFQEAKVPLVRLFSTYGATGPSADVPVEANILFAELCQKTGDLLDAYETCAVAMEQINTSKLVLGTRGGENRKYLLLRCKWTLSLLSKYIDSMAFQDAVRTRVRYADIELHHVAPWLRHRFPMSDADGSALDKYFEENEALLARG